MGQHPAQYPLERAWVTASWIARAILHFGVLFMIIYPEPNRQPALVGGLCRLEHIDLMWVEDLEILILSNQLFQGSSWAHSSFF